MFLLKMEDTLRQRIVGQDHVVKTISDAVRISRAGLQALNRPVASFLFLGPTGVGKVCRLSALDLADIDKFLDGIIQSFSILLVQR